MQTVAGGWRLKTVNRAFIEWQFVPGRQDRWRRFRSRTCSRLHHEVLGTCPEMTWEPWPKVEQRLLARYVTPDAVSVCHLVERRDDLLSKQDGRRLLIQSLYEALIKQNISYAPEKYDPQEERQQIRTPFEILQAPGE